MKVESLIGNNSDFPAPALKILMSEKNRQLPAEIAPRLSTFYFPPAITAAIVSIPSKKFFRRIFSFSAC